MARTLEELRADAHLSVEAAYRRAKEADRIIDNFYAEERPVSFINSLKSAFRIPWTAETRLFNIEADLEDCIKKLSDKPKRGSHRFALPQSWKLPLFGS